MYIQDWCWTGPYEIIHNKKRKMSNLESVNVTLELHKSSTVDLSTHLKYTLKNMKSINRVTDMWDMLLLEWKNEVQCSEN